MAHNRAVRLDNLVSCAQHLSDALALVATSEPESSAYRLGRSACLKEFELALETAGKLLRRLLLRYTSEPGTVHALTLKDVFREAALRGLIPPEDLESWLAWRDLCNRTGHDYGEEEAEEAVRQIRNFREGLDRLMSAIESRAAEGGP